METIRIIIEKTKDGYSAYADNVEGIYAMGDSVAEVKQSVKDSIETIMEFGDDIPDVLKGDYTILYKFDMESLLNYFRGIIGFAGLEALTGIHQKQLQHYSSGLHKPREKTKEKIEHSLHRFGEDLLSIEL
ncbi:type II toxin-antitoxin system HicB family antitoxin [Robiginitalea sp. SC105]|uniref:type II toxin-antitoxin system HicB family antitoxin n=1 Tax=Robiginitalea sp. SC105 TaxID=2762332 RepID=UPI001639AF75|nr:type II toxin-antitoxin system HicB family antitoxin [Robiginitalea sp. SC105]MBC2838881.1 type II toxin-antitoxin system HicB family antitoxin [Robiginitalea sp. SC105]